jgi:hypothetical protein
MSLSYLGMPYLNEDFVVAGVQDDLGMVYGQVGNAGG